MRFSSFSRLATTLCLLSAMPLVAMPRTRRGPTSPNLFRRASKSATKPAAPRGIAPERATQIQGALIKSGYLSGTPSGTWDASTEAAMQKFQADNGWQTKLIPDSRAIIKLGLGPDAAVQAHDSAVANASEAPHNTVQ